MIEDDFEIFDNVSYLSMTKDLFQIQIYEELFFRLHPINWTILNMS